MPKLLHQLKNRKFKNNVIFLIVNILPNEQLAILLAQVGPAQLQNMTFWVSTTGAGYVYSTYLVLC